MKNVRLKNIYSGNKILIFLLFAGCKIYNMSDIISETNKRSEKFLLALCFGCLISGINYGLNPFLNDIFNYLLFEVPPSRELPFKAEFLFDTKVSPGYEIAYLSQLYGIYTFATAVVSKAKSTRLK